MLSQVFLVVSLFWLARSATDLEDCEQLERQTFSPVLDELQREDASTLRRVDLTQGNDSLQCLNRNKTSSPPPCRTLQYALHESEDVTVGGEAGHLRLELGPGVYRSINESTKIINSYNISIIGAGVSQTVVVCGVNGSADTSCNYPNFQIINSTGIFVSGITFTGCGPITSSLYIALSDFVFIDSCYFQ